MDDAWNDLAFDFEPAVQAALPASALGNTRDRFRTQVNKNISSFWFFNKKRRKQIVLLLACVIGMHLARVSERDNTGVTSAAILVTNEILVPFNVSSRICFLVVRSGPHVS